MQFGKSAVSEAEFAPFPSPLASCLQRGMGQSATASSSLELLSPFVLRPAGRVNFLSLSCYPTV